MVSFTYIIKDKFGIHWQGPDCFLCRKPESLRAISLFLKEQTVVMRSGCSVLMNLAVKQGRSDNSTCGRRE